MIKKPIAAILSITIPLPVVQRHRKIFRQTMSRLCSTSPMTVNNSQAKHSAFKGALISWVGDLTKHHQTTK